MPLMQACGLEPSGISAYTYSVLAKRKECWKEIKYKSNLFQVSLVN